MNALLARYKYLVLILGLVLRIALMLYIDWHDENSAPGELKLTDIDYYVFTDGSKYMLAGGSPYERHTYRYTPLLSYLVAPSITWHRLWGKSLFVLVDAYCAYLLQHLLWLTSNSHTPAQIQALTAVWMLNPVTLNVSARGNADSIICALVLQCLLYLL